MGGGYTVKSNNEACVQQSKFTWRLKHAWEWRGGGAVTYVVGSDNELYTGGIEPIVSIH